MHLTRRSFSSLSALVFLMGCERELPPPRVPLREADEQTSLGPGDIFQLEIVGETELPKEYQVATDGTAALPYIHSIPVAGLEPQELAAEVRKRLIEEKILLNPSVIVSVKEYRSKKVTVLGQVQKPGTFPLSPGMTLLQSISMAGGLTGIAHATRVNLTRGIDGQTNTVTVDVQAMYEGRVQDIALQAGDRVYVPERVF
ncbi:MAG: polysaccharide export protein [Polyangiaceae bacterium]|nr:polysaccharide export protein [Polyangiaceae bacterium]